MTAAAQRTGLRPPPARTSSALRPVTTTPELPLDHAGAERDGLRAAWASLSPAARGRSLDAWLASRTLATCLRNLAEARRKGQP